MWCLNVFKVYRLSSKYTLKSFFVFFIYIVLKINLKQKTEKLPEADKLLK